MIDYSVYLVTGRELLPPGKDYLESLEESIKGGVTIVQIREKKADTAEFIQIAKDSKALCDRYKVPLLINDRVDVALTVKADGVHLGQTDMSIAEARRLLPNGSIVGISCNTIEHVKSAVLGGADYVGIGAVYGTQTKQLTSPLIGVRGVGAMLEALDGTDVKAVAIGGIKSTNLLRVLHGTVSSTERSLDGIAVVSDIVASPDPHSAAKKLITLFKAFKHSLLSKPANFGLHSRDQILDGVALFMDSARNLNPLIHQITNTVVATQSANLTLALGGSPIMATEAQEMEDLGRIRGALLINIGTMRAENTSGMIKAGYYANLNKKPVVFDPVGIGASAFRKQTVKDLLDVWQPSVIKGNAGELAALAGSSEVESKGVDSVGSGFKDPSAFVKKLAKKERCIVVLTGKTDYISDGFSVIALSNGNEILGKITGSGCILGSCIATYCAVAAAADSDRTNVGRLMSGHMLLAAITGVLVLTVATELAVLKKEVEGPGTFLSGLIDVLWSLRAEDVKSMSKLSVQYVD